MKNSVLIILLTLMNSCLLQKRINQEEAIERAEEFVVEQGYAYKRLNFDSIQASLDINEYNLTTEEIVKFRFNSLNPKAVYARKYGIKGWLIGFEGSNGEENYYAEDTTRRSLTAVIVSGSRKKIRMVHQTYLAKENEMLEGKNAH